MWFKVIKNNNGEVKQDCKKLCDEDIAEPETTTVPDKDTPTGLLTDPPTEGEETNGTRDQTKSEETATRNFHKLHDEDEYHGQKLDDIDFEGEAIHMLLIKSCRSWP